jgi:tetratricopeptide (TPR) repeat protein
MSEQGSVAAIPFWKHAVELDPNFALAYAALGSVYGTNLLEPGLASENIRKAYELRDRVSERERFDITAAYYVGVTGELEKAIQIHELWAQAYPRDDAPHLGLGLLDEYIGQYEKAAEEERKAIRLFQEEPISYSNLMEDYVALNRLDEAKVTYHEAIDHKLDDPFLHDDMYAIAFLQGDANEMKRQLAWATGKSGAEDLLLSAQSDSEAFYGHLERAREFSRKAVDSARRADLKETAALWQLNSALREAEFGNSRRARETTKEALSIASSRDAQILAALTLACAGDTAHAKAMADDLERQFPLQTVLKHYWLPTIHAYLAIRQGDPGLALTILEPASSYDQAFPPPQFEEGGLLYPAYVRGQAYLLLRRSKEAVQEFQKLLDHRGIVLNSPLSALAHLQLGRALAHDPPRAKIAYQDFFALWKEADPDVPILKQAKAEYAKLQ